MNAARPLHPHAVNSHVTSIIDGESVPLRAAGEDIPVVNPTTEEVVSQLREADSLEVDAAVRAARNAFDHGPWPRMDINERKDILYSIRDHLRKHADELAYLECMNAGLTLQSVRGHVQRMARNFEFFAEVSSLVHGETYTQAKGYLTYVPWNAPLALASMRVASCIPWGNTCVLKPSEYTPLSMRRMVEIFHEAGLPRGVVNLVNGRGPVTGNALVNHPDIDMVGFTGGTATGRAIAATAGKNLKPIALELGGKSANIIFDSASIDRALDGALVGIFGNNGQQCLAGSRILVQENIATEFIERFVARTKRIRLGDPQLASTEVGPLAFKAHLERVASFVDVARRDGAKLLVGGKPSADFARGYFFEPTAVLAASNDSHICQEEIFGPFATFLTFKNLDDAIQIANQSKFGLVSYVWSEDLRAVMHCSRAIRAGTVWVNTPMMRELRAPFGGFRESGIGRDGPYTSVDFFTELKSTIIPIDAPVLPRFGASS
jgi:acyl-CoA reductase-like NAD-dependent aldehyde dehydrogenase